MFESSKWIELMADLFHRHSNSTTITAYGGYGNKIVCRFLNKADSHSGNPCCMEHNLELHIHDSNWQRYVYHLCYICGEEWLDDEE